MKEITEKFSQSSKLSHAYLLIGKRTLATAIDIALQVNCPTRCGKCPTCRKIRGNSHPDVTIIGGDNKNIGIDQIRDLIKAAHLSPTETDKRIYIIDQVEDMSIPAANSFLKILESPPHYLIFILLASSLVNVLPTITSRCQVIRVEGETPTQIDNRLHQMGFNQKEREYLGWLIKAAPEVLEEIPEGNGHNLLEEREKFRDKLEKMKEEDLADFLADQENIIKLYELCIRIFEIIMDLPTYHVLKMANKLAQMDEERLIFFFKLALFWYRDLLFTQVDLHQNLKTLAFNLENNKVAKRNFKSRSLLQLLTDLSEAPWKFKRNANRKLLLEDLLIKMNQLR